MKIEGDVKLDFNDVLIKPKKEEDTGSVEECKHGRIGIDCLKLTECDDCEDALYRVCKKLRDELKAKDKKRPGRE